MKPSADSIEAGKEAGREEAEAMWRVRAVADCLERLRRVSGRDGSGVGDEPSVESRDAGLVAEGLHFVDFCIRGSGVRGVVRGEMTARGLSDREKAFRGESVDVFLDLE